MILPLGLRCRIPNFMATNHFQRAREFFRRHANACKTALLFLALALIGLLAAFNERTPSLSSLRVKMLSGGPSGNYFTVVERLGAEARRRKGSIENLPSAGSVENVARLHGGGAQFALVQDGMEWPAGHTIELIGRLGTPESLVLLGREADQIRTLADLRGKRVGIGPKGSGTEQVVRRLLPVLAELQLEVSNHSVEEQLALLQSGQLDLAALVIQENSLLLSEAIRAGPLQIANFDAAEVLARRLGYGRAGVIRAGNYDPVRNLPPVDKHVIQIDTLVIGNGSASWSATQALITTLAAQVPDFVRFNRERGNPSGLPLAPAARSYFESDGPDAVGVHAPWLVDLMPTARWIQLIFGFSVLFNVMAFWHRFRLWRIDARRVELQGQVMRLFPAGLTSAEIATQVPGAAQPATETRNEVDRLLRELEELLTICREQSLSLLVPMGQEMSYRYQETLIVDLLRDLRIARVGLERE